MDATNTGFKIFQKMSLQMFVQSHRLLTESFRLVCWIYNYDIVTLHIFIGICIFCAVENGQEKHKVTSVFISTRTETPSDQWLLDESAQLYVGPQ